MTHFIPDYGTAKGEISFSPVTKLPGGSYYVGPVLVMLVDRDVRITGLVAWATSAKYGPLSGIILLTTPETEPYTSLLEGVLEAALSPLNISRQRLAIPGTYDHGKARYNYLFELFKGFLALVLERTIVDLTTGPSAITQQLHVAASNAGVEEFQTVEILKSLSNVPPFDRLLEGVDYEIRSVPKADERSRSNSDVTVSTTPSEFNSSKQPETIKQASILFVASEPSDLARLRLGEELREIQSNLQRAKLRDRFGLQQRFSVRPEDISQALLDIQPQIVHFSGHGESAGALYFENQRGEAQPVSPDALASLFEQFADQVTCVILNACYSEIQATAIAKHIDYVIGMNQEIGDKAAIAFAVGFYQAIGAGRAIEDAFKLGCVLIKLQGVPEHLTPVLIKKHQVSL